MNGKLKTFFNSTDRKLLGAALVLILVCGYYLLVDETLFGLLRSREDDSSRPLVGQISTMENDTRHKSVKSFVWSKARKDQKVRVGDSVFTGAQSSSRVDLTEGGHVDMSENTLIQFDDVKGLKVPNLKMGNFKLSVNGTMRVKINDEVTEIQGTGSEIQVEVTENKKPKIRVTKGKPVVQGSTAVIAAAPKVEAPVPVIPPQRDPIPPPPVAPPPVAVKLEIKPIAQQTPYIYTDKLYDFYERLPQALQKRAERRREVDFPVRLQWGSNLPLAKTYGQISETPGFERSVQFFETQEQGGYTYKPVYLGTNYWRVSEDRTNWSAVEWFQVESKPLGFEPPDVVLSQESLLLLGNQVQVKAKIEAPSELKAFVVEISSDSNFPANKVRVQWTSTREITWTFKTAGEVYFRARGVNENTEITAGGPVAKLTIVRPKRAEPPRLAKDQIQVYENDSVNVAWEKSPEAKSYQVELINPKGQVIQRQKVTGSEWTWKAGPKGAYQARISSYDKFGRQSEKVSETQVLVSSKPVAKVAPPVEKRKPAAVDSTTSMKTDEVGQQTFLNRNYPSSKIELVGAGFTMYSSEQISQNTEQPFALMAGLHVQHWFNDHGAEGFLKTKLMGVNKASDEAAPLQAELRYNYRWKLNWNMFSKLRESQLSAIIGYEMYRNSSAGSIFASKYDLAKAGLGVVFPLFERWDTGGEVLYGLGADASTKLEISGFVNYYLKRDWSAGMGYRLHLFQAGSVDSAPAAGLPYREGFGEAYSVLRWHY
jgi:hypothetical protein